MEAKLATDVGVGDAISSDGTARAGPQQTWQETCARVRLVAARIQSDSVSKTEDRLLEELLVVIDAGDPLLAFLALPTLRDALARISDPAAVRAWVQRILRRSTSRDPTARFQLLRRLIRRSRNKQDFNQHEGDASGSRDGEDDDSEEDSSDADGSGASGSVPLLYLLATLENIASYADLLDSALTKPVDCYHAVHDAVMCLTDLVKRASHTAHDTGELRELVQRTVHRASSWQLGDSNAPPTFVACAIMDLIVDSRALHQQTSGTARAAQASWIEMATATLKGSLGTLAMELLLDEAVASDDACAESFVSRASSYPFVQKWIHLCCVAATDLLSLPATEYPIEWGPPMGDLQPPARRRLLTVLTEQDDILIDVVIELLAIGRCLENPSPLAPAQIRLYFENELHPDLVFADLLRVFGDDHLVVLDMLMSSETRMLEFLLQYLRHATTNWPQTAQAWKKLGRTQSVMSVLIRLRMEMERLVDTGVFPYNPAPLLRRLEALEVLYESQEQGRKKRSVFVDLYRIN